MSAIPQPLHTLAAEIYRWREGKDDGGLRPHLGASLIGHHCKRYLWFTFRWMAKSSFEGRMLRLFDRGQREEAVIVQELRGIGAEVMEFQQNGEQWRVSACGGHFGGSMDGIARKLPQGSEQNWEVIEFKTHSAKSFKELSDKGVEKAKYQHYCQVQTYMALTGMTRANYIAVNKDNDQLYHERVHADAACGKAMLERAEQVIFAAEPPPGVSSDPAWYQCKMCPFENHCHGTEAPIVNCRTCAHSTPERDGTWQCERHNFPLDAAKQKAACKSHRFIPVLLRNFAEMTDSDSADNWVKYRNTLTGAEFFNCLPPEGFESAEIHSASDKRCLGNAGVDQIRRVFDARVAA